MLLPNKTIRLSEKFPPAVFLYFAVVSYNSCYPKISQEAEPIMPEQEKTLSDEWRIAIYTAHVHFLQKRGLYEDWKRFKVGKKFKQDDPRLMAQYIDMVSKAQ